MMQNTPAGAVAADVSCVSARTVAQPGAAPVDDEAHLIRSSQNGDREACSQLLERHQRLVYWVALSRLADREAAQDVTQEALLRAFRKLHAFRGGSFQAWLRAIAVHCCSDYIRRRNQRPVLSLDRYSSDMGSRGDRLLASNEAPDVRALRREQADELWQRLLELPPDRRLVIIFGDIHGYSDDEMAVTFGWPVGTVKSRLSRARRQLRETLDRHRAP